MGKIVEEKKKKKKGRPSLLDLQKRNLREQQQQQQQQQKILIQNPNPNPNFINSNSNNRRNPINEAAAAAATAQPESNLYEEEEEEEEEDEKFKFILRLPPNQRSSSSSLISAPPPPPAAAAYLNSSGDYVFDEDGNNGGGGGGGGGETPFKRRKINAGDGSGLLYADHDEKGQNSNSKAIDDSLHDKPLEFGPTTPLPDKQLLVFILDRIQKKDTYSVFSEPVDPEELPDYHDIIKHPMDFGTVRKKLDAGAYTNLEQFEEDVFLISSNAMQYNAADTIYYRQARSIQELAKKNFENLRQESDDNEPEPEPKIVRRGRPPKHLKKPLGRPPLERAGSDFSSEAALTSGGDKPGYNLRKGHASDKSSAADASGRTRYSESSWSAEHKSERNDDFSGFMFKGTSQKFMKKLSDVDDTRRNTYLQSHSSGGGCEASVLTTFDGEKKQLMPVGLHTEHGYARSLARFAANLGPVAWKIASKKIEKALPAGINFGPGWVGENEVQQLQAPLLVTSPPRPVPPPQQPLSTQKIYQSSSVTPQILESNGIKVLARQEPSDSLASAGLLNRSLRPSSAASTSAAVNGAPEPTFEPQESGRGLIPESGFGLANSNSSGIRPPFQIHQSSTHNPALNGFTGAFATQMTKLVRPSWQHGNFSSDSSIHSRQLEAVSGSNNLAPPNNFIQPENQAIFGAAGFHHPQQIWRPPSLQQKPNSVPPDLNVRFQLPGSPSSSVRVDSSQPDLALQL